jgi:hypothetical protein
MKQKTEDRIFWGIMLVMLALFGLGFLGERLLRKECHAKGGAFINGECLRVERIK